MQGIQWLSDVEHYSTTYTLLRSKTALGSIMDSCCIDPYDSTHRNLCPIVLLCASDSYMVANRSFFS